MTRIKCVGDNSEDTQKEYPTFNEIAVNPSILNFNPNLIDEEGNVDIGSVECLDGSVFHWTIVPSLDGYALRIKTIIEGLNENYEPIYADDDQSVFCLPIRDMTQEKASGVKIGIKEYDDIPDYVPTTFDSVETAFDAFMDFAYATERGDEYYYVRQSALELINGYVDAENISFEDFKKAFNAVTKWDKYHSQWHFTPVSNAMLCLRYPFLTSWTRAKQDEEIDYSQGNWFEYTRFNEIPDGWAYRFGLELCEDLRNQAWDENPKTWEYRLREMCLHQTKEKFGTLRTYWSVYGPKAQDVLSIYEEISAITCIKCGRADKTRLTSGWISPYCWDEVMPKSEKVEKASNDFIRNNLNKNDYDWEKRCAIRDYFMLSAVVDATNPLVKSTTIENILREWKHIVWGKDGHRTENHAIGFLDGTPAPNGEPIWARQVLLDVLDDIRKMEEWVNNSFTLDDGKNYHIRNLVNEYDLEVPDWWAGLEEPVDIE